MKKREVLMILKYIKVIWVNGNGYLKDPTQNLDSRYYLNDLASNRLKASESPLLRMQLIYEINFSNNVLLSRSQISIECSATRCILTPKKLLKNL